ncbi:hypothetical protein PAL_GLEAN10015718 [Pteropus alecto]|uniref:Uncharacterized protein n=1 Tax=Pteropus alecto TaxID=9402 RepID=L5KN73_PTEAL|nr:hypothetical protein PAL_GLEAN10015718 [Pteropus alecto]
MFRTGQPGVPVDYAEVCRPHSLTDGKNFLRSELRLFNNMRLQTFKARRRVGLNLQGNRRELALVKWKNYNSRGASREHRATLYFITLQPLP